MLRGVGKTSPRTYIKCLYMFHILVLHDYWVLMESRVPLMPVLEGVRLFARCISSHEETQ